MSFPFCLKRFSLFLISQFLLLGLWAQVPQAISFQGVARDASGACRAGEHLTLSISILDDLDPENPVYSEIDTATTDANGLFVIEIGRGTATSDDFAIIDWSTRKWVKIEEGGTLLGTVEMLTVPYAFFARNGKAQNSQLTDSIAFETADGTKLVEISTQTANEGKIHVFGDGEIVGTLRSHFGSGNIDLTGRNGSVNMTLGGVDSVNANNGFISIRDAVDSTRVKMWSQPNLLGAGNIVTYGGNGTVNTTMGSGGANFENKGNMSVRDENGTLRAILSIDDHNNGYFRVIDSSGTIIGQMSPGLKLFIIAHPTQPDKEIAYVSLEGPEAAAYERGTATLINGEAVITFSEHFQLVIAAESMTINLTPKSAASKGLAVIQQSETGFNVQELFEGSGTYEFHWEAKAKRKGFEDFEVIRDRKNIEE